MDHNENTPTDDVAFGKELAKDFGKSIATSAGLWTGIIATVIAYGKINKAWTARQDKKNRIKTEN